MGERRTEEPINSELRQIADLALFARIVQAGGISRCAEALGMERTTISRRLGALERALGVKLLERTPRRVSVTDAGKRCFEHCEQLLLCASTAHAAVTDIPLSPAIVPLVVAAPADIFDHSLDAALSDFEQKHASLLVERSLFSSWNDDTFDSIDICVDWKSPPKGLGITRKLVEVPQSVYASPDYTGRAPAPLSPYEIDLHACIVAGDVRERPVWQFTAGTEKTRIHIRPRSVVASLLEAREAAAAGLGVSLLPDYLCESMVHSGRLERLLPDYLADPRPLFLSWSRHASIKPKATGLRMHIETAYHSTPPV